MIQPGDRERAINALTIWYRASGLQYQGKSFQDVLGFYDSQNPDYIAGFGEILRMDGVTAAKIEDAMTNVASEAPGQVPKFYAFGNALVGSVGSFGVEDLQQVISQSVSDVASVAKAGLGIYIGILAVGAVLVLWETTRGARASK